MTMTTFAPTADLHAERWQQWQQAYAASNRKSATRARILFTVILTVLTGWLGLQLLQPWA
jgi:hypothetical protein